MDKENYLQQQIDELRQEMNNLKSADTIPLEVQNAFIKRGFMKFDSNLTFYGGTKGMAFYYIFTEFENQKALFSITPSTDFKIFSVNTSTEICTSLNHGFADGKQLLLYSTDTLPGGLDAAGVSFWVMNTTTDTFKLSSDGTNVSNITSNGVGTHYAQLFL